jgi:hypothetical protein
LLPEQVWRDGEEPLLGQFVAMLADVGVHPEHLVQNDDGGGGNDDAICHWRTATA